MKKTDYIWAETTLCCEVDDGEVYYHHTDHLGTTEAVTDSTGKVVWHAEYEAFGSVLSENGSMAFTPGFTGKMMDDCSGLYYFNARRYDSECGRFTTQDPARDGVNWYTYCSNNPLLFVDLLGLSKEDWQNNEDGTWTVKSEGATLWNIYGSDWKEKSGYEGDPTKLQIGDTVGIKKEEDSILTRFDFISTSVDMITGIAEYKAKVPEFIEATSHSLPYPVLKDPELIATHSKLSALSKSLLYISIGLDIVDGINAGIKSDSFARGAYRTATNLTTTGIAVGGSFLGAAIGTSIAPVAGSIVGGIAGGTIAGYFADLGFSKLEIYLFEEKDNEEN